MSVAKIDPNSLLSNGTTHYMTLNTNFNLKGGFKTFDGNCVVYGSELSLSGNSTPAFAAFETSTNLLKYFNNISIGNRILDGCAGYDINGNQIYMFVLDNGQMIAVDMSSNITSITANEYYTDISWDDTHNFFVATGPISYGLSYPRFFVDLFTFDASTPPAINHTLQYYVDNNAIPGMAEHQAMHVKLHDDTLLVFRDLRTSTEEVIWLTTIYNYWDPSRVVDSSYFFHVPTHKLVALDMLYDPIHQRLNFLGEFIYCTTHNSQFLAQVDPYNFYLGMKAKQLDGGFAISPPCPSTTSPTIDIYGSYLNTTNLALDIYHECVPLLIAGAGWYPSLADDRSILTETYDISQSDCDQELPVVWKPASPIIANCQLTTTLGNPSCGITYPQPLIDNVTESILCYGPDACPSLERDSLTKALPITSESKQDIVLSECKQFYCTGFDGSIQYCFYDMTGSLVSTGKTYSGQYNPLPEKCGIYILRAMDSKGNLSVKKVFSLP